MKMFQDTSLCLFFFICMIVILILFWIIDLFKVAACFIDDISRYIFSAVK